MRIIRAADCRVMPWKNGGGSTTEIAVHPPGAGMDDFLWRVSMARVEGDGPFSSFAGIDRTLAILNGAGIRLTVAGGATELTQASAPFAFAGDVPTSATLIDGPVTDLNVMTRRAALRHRVWRVVWPVDVKPASTSVVFCARGGCTIEAGEKVELAAGDAAVFENEPLRIVPKGEASIYYAEIV